MMFKLHLCREIAMLASSACHGHQPKLLLKSSPNQYLVRPALLVLASALLALTVSKVKLTLFRALKIPFVRIQVRKNTFFNFK